MPAHSIAILVVAIDAADPRGIAAKMEVQQQDKKQICGRGGGVEEEIPGSADGGLQGQFHQASGSQGQKRACIRVQCQTSGLPCEVYGRK